MRGERNGFETDIEVFFQKVSSLCFDTKFRAEKSTLSIFNDGKVPEWNHQAIFSRCQPHNIKVLMNRIHTATFSICARELTEKLIHCLPSLKAFFHENNSPKCALNLLIEISTEGQICLQLNIDINYFRVFIVQWHVRYRFVCTF